MCQAYEAEANFVSWLESKAPYCPLCKTEKAILYPHCGRCQAKAAQSARIGLPLCKCDWCKEIPEEKFLSQTERQRVINNYLR